MCSIHLIGKNLTKRRILIKPNRKNQESVKSQKRKKALHEIKKEIPKNSTENSSKFVNPDTLWKNIALNEFKKRQDLAKKREEFLKKFRKEELPEKA